jgi:acetolactate synthase-1/2/3 large subunit
MLNEKVSGNMSNQNQYMHQSIAQAVSDHEIDTIFGLVGDANLFIVNHFVSECGGTLVPAAHEGGTVLMAQAYTQVTKQVGVATVTQGPGLTNCVTALREGVVARRPMILLCGDTPVTASFHPQNIDQRLRQLAQDLNKFSPPTLHHVMLQEQFIVRAWKSDQLL